MDNNKIRGIVEIIGVTSIVASLIFVGLELRQSHEIALSEQYQSRSQSIQDLYLTSFEVGVDPQKLNQTPADQLTESDLARQIALYHYLITQFDNVHYQYELGFIDEDSFSPMAFRMETVLRSDNAQDVYQQRRRYLRSSLVAFMDDFE